MQVSKHLTGTCTAGSSTTRIKSWGGSYSGKVYSGHDEFINQAIADFLVNDCGVDGVAYEARGDYTEKYVWIYDVPFHFGPTATAGTFYVSHPFDSSYLTYSSSTVSPFSGAATGVYDFYMYFTGSAEAGFCLRFTPYGSTTPHSIMCRFIPCTNICTGRTALVYDAGAGNRSVSAAYGLCGGHRVLETENGFPVSDCGVTEDDTAYFPVSISLNGYQKNYMDGKLPLMPVMYGIYKADKCYMHVRPSILPAAATYSTVAQTETTIGNKTFIVTTADSTSTSYINMGLIDVT